MLNNAELYLIHGWGFNSRVWENWLPFIEDSVSPYVFDRGYFKSDKQKFALNTSEQFKILVAHSYGLHYLSAIDLSQVQMLVLISSFRYFHEYSQNPRLGQKQMALMKQQLMLNPSKVLQEFYANCGLEKESTNKLLINQQLLYDDLCALDSNEIDLGILKSIPQILLLHGSKDRVIDFEHSKGLNNKLANSKLFIHNQIGHSLPITNSKWCLDTIQTELSIKIFADLEPVRDNQSHEQYIEG